MFMPLEKYNRTGIAIDLTEKLKRNPDYYTRNFLVDLGQHTTPLFLFKNILPQLRKELVFNERISFLSNRMLQQVKKAEKTKNLVFVGIHVRRGDKIEKWKQKEIYRESFIGRYEGEFFNYAMDMMRERFNNHSQKVVFIPTSDNYYWIKKNLVNKNDIYFSRQLVQETRVALPNKKEIHQLWNNPKLAVKGELATD